MFGGKEQDTKKITNKAYEIVWTEHDSFEMVPINRMFKNRSRSTVACINKSIGGYDPFLVIIGGSDEFSTINQCELYYPKTNSYFAFPSLVIARENASSCIFEATKDFEESTPGAVTDSKSRLGFYIYCFGGFDKKSIDEIERIKITFSTDLNETSNGLHPIVESKWERLKNVTMLKSVECCGTV